MTAWRAWLRPRRPLMLRTRFTLAAAGAVAAVTLAVTAVAFLVLRSDLQDQVQQQLRQQSEVVYRVAGHYHGHIPHGWVPPDRRILPIPPTKRKPQAKKAKVNVTAGNGPGTMPFRWVKMLG